MLEALLNHFRSYGMDDLEFIIVNSKLSHAQDKLHELKKRVSFEVYQETDEEEVWSVMEGGKDDMYVYDRCGRLTYYVPFPLSILNESPIVSNAVLATYFGNPCGDNCDENKTFKIDDFVKKIEKDFETANDTDPENAAFVGTEQPTFNNETSNDTLTSNDLLYIIEPANNEINMLNFTNSGNLTDADYPLYDNSSHVNETNSPSVNKEKSIFNSIYELFFNIGNKNVNTFENSNNSITLNETFSGNSTQPTMTNNDRNHETSSNHLLHHVSHAHHQHGRKVNNGGKKKSDRCLEADYEVCKSWSKMRLLHAQKCCSEIHSDTGTQDHKSCIGFQKKRCKKIQSILKCCIRTTYAETTVVTTTEEPSTVPIVLTTEDQKETTQVADVVCCKVTDNGKLCRVSSSSICEEGEYVERSPSESK